jgi:hypothetical protein
MFNFVDVLNDTNGLLILTMVKRIAKGMKLFFKDVLLLSLSCAWLCCIRELMFNFVDMLNDTIGILILTMAKRISKEPEI